MYLLIMAYPVHFKRYILPKEVKDTIAADSTDSHETLCVFSSLHSLKYRLQSRYQWLRSKLGLRMGSSGSSIPVLLPTLYILSLGQHLLSIGVITFPAVQRAKSFSNDFSYPFDAFTLRSCNQEVSKNVEKYEMGTWWSCHILLNSDLSNEWWRFNLYPCSRRRAF